MGIPIDSIWSGTALDVVGHDLGTWIAYAYAAEWPDDVKRLAVFDAALPCITPPPPAGIPSAELPHPATALADCMNIISTRSLQTLQNAWWATVRRAEYMRIVREGKAECPTSGNVVLREDEAGSSFGEGDTVTVLLGAAQRKRHRLSFMRNGREIGAACLLPQVKGRGKAAAYTLAVQPYMGGAALLL